MIECQAILQGRLLSNEAWEQSDAGTQERLLGLPTETPFADFERSCIHSLRQNYRDACADLIQFSP